MGRLQGCAGIGRSSKTLWLGVMALLVALGTCRSVLGLAAAAPLPATPLEVAPGVPGNGRAWELVTSEEPSSAIVYPEGIASFVAPSGNRALYVTLGKLPSAPEQEWLFNTNLATRGDSGWTDAWAPRPNAEADDPYFEAVDGDLGEAINLVYLPNGQAAYQRVAADGSATVMATAPSGGLGFVGASEDLRRLYFSSSAHLIPADAERTSGASIYEADASGTHLVDVDGVGHPLSDCGSDPLTGGQLPDGGVSTDGRRIYFRTQPGCSGPAEVYLAGAGSAPVEVSASRCDLADCGPEADVSLVAMTPDGSEAYLRTTQRLTDDDTDSRNSLYRYNADGGDLTLLTPSSADLTGNAGVVASADGSAVFFTSGVEGAIGESLFEIDSSGLHRLPISQPQGLEVSFDGHVVVVETEAALLPQDTDSARDVYRYGDRDQRLTLVSAGGGGDQPAFIASEFGRTELRLPPDDPARSISADGSRIFFTTAEALVPQDRNQASDVYEWQDGSLSLVSAGAGEEDSVLDGVTPDGSSAFFSTAATLLPRDRDGGERDIYVARTGGGFPEPTSPQCLSEACALALLAQGPPARPAARSATSAVRIRIGRVDAADRRRIAATGWLALLAEVPRRGDLQAEARAGIGGRVHIVAETRIKVTSPGPVRLRTRLSQLARSRLAAGRSLRLHLRLRLGHGVPTARMRIELGGSR